MGGVGEMKGRGRKATRKKGGEEEEKRGGGGDRERGRVEVRSGGGGMGAGAANGELIGWRVGGDVGISLKVRTLKSGGGSGEGADAWGAV